MSRSTVLCTGSVLLALAGCSDPSYEPPPNFNAVDPSMQCEAGYVGWDFATGGTFDEAVRNARLSNEITIVTATYGANRGVDAGNWTEKFAGACNGKIECSRRVLLPGDKDPVPGKTKNFWIHYRCGVETPVYVGYYSSEAAYKTVTVRCGQKMNIVSASYGENCDSKLAGNFTAKMRELCSGLRRCRHKAGNGLFGSDPAPKCAKKTEVSYQCGNDPTILEASVAENTYLDIQCAARAPSASNSPTITVDGASYGANCGASSDNWTSKYQGACDGKLSCSRRVLAAGDGDPAYGCAKSFSLTYRCGGSEPPSTVFYPAEAAWQTVALKCGMPMQILSAKYGAGSCQKDVIDTAQACNGARRCSFEKKGNALFGDPDPCPGIVKKSTFTFSCGVLGTKTVTFAEGDRIDFECPQEPVQPRYATGIRIDEATYGGNCNNGEALKNNRYTEVVSACYAKDTCTYTVTRDAWNSDKERCADGEQGAFDLTYHCGEDTAKQTVHVDAEAHTKTVTLTCGQMVVIHSATVEACDGNSMDITGSIFDACKGSRGVCSVPPLEVGTSGSPPPDPTPPNTKASMPPAAPLPLDCTVGQTLAVSYSCGANPEVKTASGAMTTQETGTCDPGVISTTDPCVTRVYTPALTLSCDGVPAVPPKACVPRKCSGRERRDEKLNCVPDLSLLELSAFDYSYQTPELRVVEWNDQTPDDWENSAASFGQTTGLQYSFKEDTLYGIYLGLHFKDDLPIAEDTPVADAGTEDNETEDPPVADAEIWAYDAFETTSGAKTYGFRCVVGRVSMLRHPVNTKKLEAKIDKLSLPPACFGPAVPSWRDAAKRLFLTEAEFRSQYKRVEDETRLAVSFDPEGRTYAKRSPHDPSFMVPNPVGFFYDPKRLWIDWLNYRQQTEVGPGAFARDLTTEFQPPDTNFKVQMAESNDIVLRALDAKVRNPEVELNGVAYPKVDSFMYSESYGHLEIDFTWAKQGDSPGRNPFSPTDPPLDANIKTLQQRNLRARVDLARHDELTNGVWPEDKSLALGEVALDDGEAAGRTVRINALLDGEVKEKLFGEWLKDGEANTDTLFRIRVCMMVDGSLVDAIGSVWRGPVNYKAGFAPGERCVIPETAVAVRRRLDVCAIPPEIKTMSRYFGHARDDGNTKSTTEQNHTSERTCSRRCTNDADCGAGQTCNPQEKKCSGSGPDTGCTLVNKSLVGSTGTFGIEVAEMTSEASYSVGDSSIKGSSSTRGDLLGIEVVNTEGSPNAFQSDFETITSSALLDFSLDIKWDKIVALFKGQSLGGPLDVKPKYFDEDLTGIFVGYKQNFPLFTGVVASVGLGGSIGWGLGLNLSAGTADDYCPSLDGNQDGCLEVHDDEVTLDQAQNACEKDGGRLAVIDEDLADLLKNKTAGKTKDYWLGAQLCYAYPKSSCVENLTQDCIDNGKTWYRWIADGSAIASQTASGLPVAEEGTAFSAALDDLDPRLSTAVAAGVIYRPPSDTQGEGSLRSEPMTEKHPYVCQKFPASGGTKLTGSVAGGFGADVGLSLSVCVPSPDAGLCLGGSLSMLNLQFGLEAGSWEARMEGEPGRTIGQNFFNLSAEGLLLSASLWAELRMLFYSKRWTLLRYRAGRFCPGDKSGAFDINCDPTVFETKGSLHVIHEPPQQ